jgi:DNA-binding NtrC family response regulator
MDDLETLTLAEITQRAVESRLSLLLGNKRQAAESLGISRSTLYRILGNMEARKQ